MKSHMEYKDLMSVLLMPMTKGISKCGLPEWE